MLLNKGTCVKLIFETSISFLVFRLFKRLLYCLYYRNALAQVIVCNIQKIIRQFFFASQQYNNSLINRMQLLKKKKLKKRAKLIYFLTFHKILHRKKCNIIDFEIILH